MRWSPLNRIKASSSNPSVGGMKRLLARLELGSRRGLGQRQLPADPVPQRANRVSRPGVQDGGPTPSPRAGVLPAPDVSAPRSTKPSTCTVSSSTAIASWSRPALTTLLKAQRQAVDRIVHRYRQLSAVLLDPDVGDDELRARLLSTVPEAQLREDQSDLANWTRGDRKARFEQTAERHAGLSQFAGPFLSRMKFVDEQGEGTSATLSAAAGPAQGRAAQARGAEGGALPEPRPGGAPADGPGTRAAARPGDDQAAGRHRGAPALDVLPYVPGGHGHGRRDRTHHNLTGALGSGMREGSA